MASSTSGCNPKTAETKSRRKKYLDVEVPECDGDHSICRRRALQKIYEQPRTSPELLLNRDLHVFFLGLVLLWTIGFMQSNLSLKCLRIFAAKVRVIVGRKGRLPVLVKQLHCNHLFLMLVFKRHVQWSVVCKHLVWRLRHHRAGCKRMVLKLKPFPTGKPSPSIHATFATRSTSRIVTKTIVWASWKNQRPFSPAPPAPVCRNLATQFQHQVDCSTMFLHLFCSIEWFHS